MTNYLKYYDLERYLFEEVGPSFRSSGTLDPVDFYTILIWKANRAKTRHRDRLSKHAAGFEGAVQEIASELHGCPDRKGKLSFLIGDKWKFRLPTASAILTVLYPDDFTVYDVRVCNALGDHSGLDQKSDFDEMWAGYERFIGQVRDTTPAGLSLRNKDRYLWGKSFYADVQKDLGLTP